MIGGTVAPESVGTATSLLASNLGAIDARLSAEALRALEAATPCPALSFMQTEEGVLSADLNETLASGEARSIALASRRRPIAEARVLAKSVDIAGAGVFVIAGFGLGYHVREILERVDRSALVIVFEPDVALLRSVLERVDHASWLGAPNLVILTDQDDAPTLSQTLARVEGLVGLGVRLIEHPPSKARLLGLTTRFYEHLTRAIDSVKMVVMTTLVQTRVTMRNLTQNVDVYAESGGISDLKGVCAGMPALVVAAGPSLARTIDELARPGVRDRFVIVAVQTVLKPLLARGIKPHFITALDYAEIGKRFYEGLSSADVEGITLVMEPKVNPAVPTAWPGKSRCVGDAIMDKLLGDLARPKGTIPGGATVAHLAYYLARHLGCDPVVLVGQDLGFTDGQYYASGASIHNVWGGELNDLNTLDMLEWQRIVRQGGHLRKVTDTLGRPIYSDEQMVTYLGHFERSFKVDRERGLTILDAGGGVHKRHTTLVSLKDIIDEQMGRTSAGGVSIPPPPDREIDRRVLGKRVRHVREQVRRVGELSEKAVGLLTEIIEHQADQSRVDRVIARLEALTSRVVALSPGYHLTQSYTQIAAFARLRADRAIRVENDLSPMQRQVREAERDLENVRHLAHASVEFGALLDASQRSLEGAPKITREDRHGTGLGGAEDLPAAAPARSVVAAIVVADTRREHLRRPFAGFANVLSATMSSVMKIEGLDQIVVLTENARVARELLADIDLGDRVRLEACDPMALAQLRSRTRAARSFSAECWRGGLGNASIFDEVFPAQQVARAMTDLSIDAALLIGGDWALVDPEVCAAMIARHRESPQSFRFVFSQGAPGLAPCLVDRELAQQLAGAATMSGSSMPIGAVLGYVPQAPMNDLIASSSNVGIPISLRDVGVRCIPDSRARFASLERALMSVRASGSTTSDLLGALKSAASRAADGPEYVEIELAPSPALALAGRTATPSASIELIARQTLDELAALNPDARVTLVAGSSSGGDPTREHATGERALHQAIALVHHARALGLPVPHVRTTLECDRTIVDELIESGVECVSVDLLAHTPETLQRLTGRSGHRTIVANIEHALDCRAGVHQRDGRSLWIVPRLTRCDAVYEEIEAFFAHWFERAGWCVLDPLASVRPGERIGPLMLPDSVRRREARSRLSILCDGSVLALPRWTRESTHVARLPASTLSVAWKLALEARATALQGGEV